MQPEELFALALDVKDPWKVTEIAFFRDRKRLDIKVDFNREALFPCPVCGDMVRVYDTTSKTWHHMNFIQHEAYLTAHVPQVRCPRDGCGIKQVTVPWELAGWTQP